MLVAGGGLAGLVTAAACHAKGMQVAIFEQASSYAPYGGPIQIQSNALRAIERISPTVFQELLAAGTVTADRVSGLKIGYKKGNPLAGIYERGDWLVGAFHQIVILEGMEEIYKHEGFRLCICSNMQPIFFSRPCSRFPLYLRALLVAFTSFRNRCDLTL